MKLLVLCLLAVACYPMEGLASDSTMVNRKLREVLKEVKRLKDSLKQHNGPMLNTPPQDMEDCCSVSALWCFQANLRKLSTPTLQRKLIKSLKDPLTVKGLTFCAPENLTISDCPSCESYPKKEPQEFLRQLESLIQRALVRLVS